MEQNSCDEVTKRTVYFFKKYAREKEFWEEYKALSTPLNPPRYRFSSDRKPITFIELVKEYEKIESNIDDKMPTSFAYDLGRMATFELFLQLLGVQFETGDQAQGHHIDNK